MRIAIIITIMNNTDNLIVRGVPVTSTIVEFDDHTLSIIDTGMADNPDLIKQLDNMGYKPSDFSFVFNTHLHPDHIGGNRHFKNARIFISRKELVYHQSLENACHTSGTVPDIPGSMLIREMMEKYPIADLIGAPGQIEFLEDHSLLPRNIKLIPTPGHSIDDHAIILQGRIKEVLIVGDALYHRNLWRETSIPGINFNEDMFYQCAQCLSEFPGIIVPGHDFAFDNATCEYLEANEFINI